MDKEFQETNCYKAIRRIINRKSIEINNMKFLSKKAAIEKFQNETSLDLIFLFQHWYEYQEKGYKTLYKALIKKIETKELEITSNCKICNKKLLIYTIEDYIDNSQVKCLDCLKKEKNN